MRKRKKNRSRNTDKSGESFESTELEANNEIVDYEQQATINENSKAKATNNNKSLAGKDLSYPEIIAPKELSPFTGNIDIVKINDVSDAINPTVLDNASTNADKLITKAELDSTGTLVKDDSNDSEGDYLEEEYYTPTVINNDALVIGEIVKFGDQEFTVDEALAGSLYKAHLENADQDTFVLLSTKILSPLWQDLPPQRLLPEIIYEGNDGYVLAWTEGELLEPKLPWQDILEYLNPLAQLLRFFAVQGIAVVDINPNGLILTEQGLKLRYPIQIVKVGEEVNLVPRDSFTPTEVQINKLAGVKAGIYLWGAIFYYLYTGEPVPVEGISLLELTAIHEPGLPQLFYATLSPVHNRIDATTLQSRIKTLQQPQRPIFEVVAATTIGLSPEREINEDSYGFVQHSLETFAGTKQILRACVADGMGGEIAGELASQAAVTSFCEAPLLENASDLQAQANWAVDLVWQANEAVFKALDENSGGCTFTGVVVVDKYLALAHVGDSRAYLYSKQGLQPLTCDHSLVKAMIAQGVITEEEAENSPDANKVIRSLGSRKQHQEDDAYIDTLASLTDDNSQPIFDQTREFLPDELVLLMSDGVWGVWGYKESLIRKNLTDIIKASKTTQQIADDLVAAALEAGAPDNATVVIVKCIR